MNNKWQDRWYVDLEPRDTPMSTVDWYKLYFQLRYANEHVYVGDIPILELDAYRQRYVDKDIIMINNQFQLTSSDHLELITKLTVLAESYIEDNNKFDKPIQTWYSPRTDEIVIHPGTKRWLVYKLFTQSDTIKGYYFSTRGHLPNWAKSLEKADLRDLDIESFWCLLDSNSAIPQWHHTNNRRNLGDQAIITKTKITNMCLSYRHHSNLDGFFPNLFKYSKEESTRKVFFKDKSSVTDELQLKALILCFLKDRYEDDQIIIK